MIKWRLFSMKYFWNYILAITTKWLQDILNLYISNLKKLTYIYIQQYSIFFLVTNHSQFIFYWKSPEFIPPILDVWWKTIPPSKKYGWKCIGLPNLKNLTLKGSHSCVCDACYNPIFQWRYRWICFTPLTRMAWNAEHDILVVYSETNLDGMISTCNTCCNSYFLWWRRWEHFYFN